MEKNTSNEENYISYYNYVKDNMAIINSSGSKLVLSKIDEIDSTVLDIGDIRKLCELVEFIRISENVKNLALYHEWYRHFRI